MYQLLSSFLINMLFLNSLLSTSIYLDSDNYKTQVLQLHANKITLGKRNLPKIEKSIHQEEERHEHLTSYDTSVINDLIKERLLERLKSLYVVTTRSR